MDRESAANRCPNCGYTFYTLADEWGTYDCPRCGYSPREEDEREKDERERKKMKAIVSIGYHEFLIRGESNIQRILGIIDALPIDRVEGDTHFRRRVKTRKDYRPTIEVFSDKDVTLVEEDETPTGGGGRGE